MSVSWNNKEYQPEQIVEKIESARKKTQFIGWELYEFAALVYSMLDFSDKIPEIDARGLVTRAILNSVAKGAITPKSLLAEINRLEKGYHSLPIEKYVLVSSISINQSWVLKRIRWGNTLIIFEKSLPTKFRKESESLLRNAELSLFADRPINYLNVRVYATAKSIHHAADQALEALDFTRGIWNWVLNRRYSRRMSLAGKPQPVNNISLGPIHTLHRTDGKLVTSDVWWYEPNFLGEMRLFTPNPNEIETINKIFNFVRKAFKKHKYPQVIHDAIVRYTRALDERDLATAFIKVWSILELLTDTDKAASYDTTIKRAAFLYREPEYHFQILKHLKKYRNSSVHLDKENSEIEIYLYQLKRYVENLIDFHINNKFSFKTIQEAAAFLDLSHEVDVLRNQEKTFKEQIKKRNLARRFLGLSKGG